MVWLRETDPKGLGAEPLFVTPKMVIKVAKRALEVIEVPISRAGNNLFDMIYGPLDAPVASEMLSVAMHHEIAAELVPSVAQHL